MCKITTYTDNTTVHNDFIGSTGYYRLIMKRKPIVIHQNSSIITVATTMITAIPRNSITFASS